MANQNPPLFESLEDRCLLSASVGLVAPLLVGPVGPASVASPHPVTANCSGGGAVAGILGDLKSTGHAQTICATVVSVDTTANTITVSSPSFHNRTTQTTYAVSPTATLMIDGAAATLGQFIAGVKVTLVTAPTDPTTVASITAVGQDVDGSVAAVDPVAGTITLAGRRGATGPTYTIGATVPVTVNGQPGAVAGIIVGAEVEIKLSALNSATVISVNAEFREPNGAVVSVDTTANTITVSSTSQGKATQTTYAVEPTATLTIDGAAATLGQFVAGVKVSLNLDPKDATSVTSVTAVGTQVEGDVAAVDPVAGTITLAGRHGATGPTYTIGATVPVTVNGQTGAVAGIIVGADVQIKFSALNSATVIAVTAEFSGPTGSVVSVDTVANTITLTSNGHGKGAPITYTVSPTATLTIDGAAATLGQFAAGMKVTLATDPTNASLIASITAVNKEIDGRVSSVNATAGTITLGGQHGGKGTTYTIGAAVPVTINGFPSTLSAITAGSDAELTLSALDNTTVVAVDVRT